MPPLFRYDGGFDPRPNLICVPSHEQTLFERERRASGPADSPLFPSAPSPAPHHFRRNLPVTRGIREHHRSATSLARQSRVYRKHRACSLNGLEFLAGSPRSIIFNLRVTNPAIFISSHSIFLVHGEIVIIIFYHNYVDVASRHFRVYCTVRLY